MLLHSQNMSVTHIENFLEALEGEVLHTRTKMLLNHFKDVINNQLYTWAKYNPPRLSELNIEISFWLKCWKVYDCDVSITILGTYFSVVLCDILKTSESQKCIVIRIWNKFRSQTSNKKFWKKFWNFFGIQNERFSRSSFLYEGLHLQGPLKNFLCGLQTYSDYVTTSSDSRLYNDTTIIAFGLLEKIRHMFMKKVYLHLLFESHFSINQKSSFFFSKMILRLI